MKSGDILKLVAAITVSQMAGIIGSFFTIPAIPTWYAGLAKPSFAPPNGVFAPVWTTLFLLMGIAAFLVWRTASKKNEVRTGLILFAVQLLLNLCWSIVFFGLREPGWALAEITVLCLAVLATIIAFSKVSRLAAWLMSPYLVWIAFAAYLNYAIWKLN